MSPSGAYGAPAGGGANTPGDESARALGGKSAITSIYFPGVTGCPVSVVARTPDAAAVVITAATDAGLLPSAPANGGMLNGILTTAVTASPAFTLISWLAVRTVRSPPMT